MHGRDAATSPSLWIGCDPRNTLRHIRTGRRYVVSKLLNTSSAWGIGSDGGRLARRAPARKAGWCVGPTIDAAPWTVPKCPCGGSPGRCPLGASGMREL